MSEIMLDIETLDSTNRAVIVSIGAVKFSLLSGKILGEFYAICDEKGIDYQWNYLHRDLSIRNLRWWMNQSDEARKVWRYDQKVSCLDDILDNFDQFCSSNCRVWGNGITFDNANLRSLYTDMNMNCPFHYKNDMCYRTYKNLYGKKIPLERIGNHHNALDDAISQAMHLVKMYKEVKND